MINTSKDECITSLFCRNALSPPMPDLIGLTLTLCPTQSFTVPSQYTIELHSWFLDQVRRVDADLSAYMHDGQSEKPFTISGLLDGELLHQSDRKLLVQSGQSYHWVVTALSANVADWMQNWTPPNEMRLKSGTLTIEHCAIAPSAMTYEALWAQAGEQMEKERASSLCFTFLSPTSFRQHGNHLPLPIPANVFQSYLRRWNHFVDLEFDAVEFKQWVEEYVVILRHQIQSSKVQAGKQGSVTGFTGSVQFGHWFRWVGRHKAMILVH
jgi:CRISPR-associated endoribonuclease Cas6